MRDENGSMVMVASKKEHAVKELEDIELLDILRGLNAYGNNRPDCGE